MTHLFSENDKKWNITMKAYDNKTEELTPMRMLIEHMPGVLLLVSCTEYFSYYLQMFITYFALLFHVTPQMLQSWL